MQRPSRQGLHVLISCRIKNGRNCPQYSKQIMGAVNDPAVVNIKIKYLAPPMPRAGTIRSARRVLRSSKTSAWESRRQSCHYPV